MTELKVGRIVDRDNREQWIRAQRHIQYFHEDVDGGPMAAHTIAFDDQTTFHNLTAGSGGTGGLVGTGGFEKRGGAGETYLMFHFNFGWWVDASGFGIVTRGLFTHNGGTTFASDRVHIFGAKVASTRSIATAWDSSKLSALPAGTYTLKIQWRFQGSGIYNFRSDVNESWSVMLREWAADKSNGPVPTGTQT